MPSRRTIERLLGAVLAASLAGIAVVAVSAAGGLRGSTATADSTTFDGPTMPPNLPAPPFSLTDQNGRYVTLAGLRGRVVLVTFIHSKCTTTCPLTVETIKGALNLLSAGEVRSVSAVAVTAAPAEDTVRSRRAFLALHGMTGRLAYLNGPLPAVQAVWNGYHVLPVKPGAAPDAHTTYTFLIDRRGIERVGWPDAQLTPEDLAHDLRMLVRERS